MQKVTFIRTVKVARGDGSGPVFEAGKTYLMRPDSVLYWRGEDAIVDAAPDAVAENEPAVPALRASDIRIRNVGRNRFDVFVRGIKANDMPLRSAEAEDLRRGLLVGEVPLPLAVAPSIDASTRPVLADPASSVGEVDRDATPSAEEADAGDSAAATVGDQAAPAASDPGHDLP